MDNNAQNKVSNPYEGKGKEELRLLAAQEMQKGSTESLKKAGEILKELEERENKGTPESEAEKFGKIYEETTNQLKEIQNKIDTLNKKSSKSKEELIDLIRAKKEKDALVKKFLENDIKNHQGNIVSNQKEITDAKDAKIRELQNQLNETITTMPKLGEYLSLERRRLVTVKTNLDKFNTPENKANGSYPKNFLIYAMGVANHSLFGINDKIKRTGVKMMRKRKNDDIKGNLETLEKKLTISTSDEKKPRKRTLKLMIQSELIEAKKAYLEQQRESLGLAA